MPAKKKVVNNKIFIYKPKTLELDTVTEQFKTQLTSETKEFKNKTIRDKLGEPHPFDYSVAEGIVKKFGLANAVVDKISDFAIGPEMIIQSEDKKAQEILEKWIDKTNFRAFLRPWLKEALIKGSGYLEIAGLNDTDKESNVKIVNADTMFIKRDKFGKITSYNQFIGDSKKISTISDEDIIPLKPEEIAHLNINKIGSSSYGMGIIFSAITTINDFLLAQKSIHTLTKRKANSPIWVKLGNAEKDDYPQQEDIDNFGEKLQFMDECTEWVTGPNVDIKILDFGNVGDKFTTILDNDYKLLSFCFQVPETIMGAGNVAEGLAKVQMDSFDRRIKSIQDEISLVVKGILTRILKKNGFDIEFNIIWGELNEEDKVNLIRVYNEILKSPTTSVGLRKAFEEKISQLADIDYDQVVADNEEAEAKREQELRQHPERKREEEEPLPEIPGQKSIEKGIYKHIHEDYNENEEELNNLTIKEWINFDYQELLGDIISTIAIDNFVSLRATNRKERELGYLDLNKTNKLRNIFEKGFKSNSSVKDIENNILKIGVGPLYKINKKGNKVIAISATRRANMIARTETVRLANLGNIKFYKKKNIERVRWIASMSKRTCPICESLNGRIMNINEVLLPPAHVDCRCSTIPVVEEI